MYSVSLLNIEFILGLFLTLIKRFSPGRLRNLWVLRKSPPDLDLEQEQFPQLFDDDVGLSNLCENNISINPTRDT